MSRCWGSSGSPTRPRAACAPGAVAGPTGPLVEPRAGARRDVRVGDRGLAVLAPATTPVAAARRKAVAGGAAHAEPGGMRQPAPPIERPGEGDRPVRAPQVDKLVGRPHQEAPEAHAENAHQERDEYDRDHDLRTEVELVPVAIGVTRRSCAAPTRSARARWGHARAWRSADPAAYRGGRTWWSSWSPAHGSPMAATRSPTLRMVQRSGARSGSSSSSQRIGADTGAPGRGRTA